jgi:hypothetical protein
VRALMVCVIVVAGIVLFQSERNQCYWHGTENWVAWVRCVGGFRWQGRSRLLPITPTIDGTH